MQFSVSIACTMTAVWFYSAPGAGALPGTIVLYNATLESVIHSESASWSGAAGSGWVRAAFGTPPSLVSSTQYAVSVYQSTSVNWYSATATYWTTGPGASGITSGILTAPSSAASILGQDFFNASSSQYPAGANGANYWIDPEVFVPSGNGPTGNPSGGPWVLAFEDHFDTTYPTPSGTGPNPAVWADHLIEGDYFRCNDNATEVEWSSHNKRPFSVASSFLTITARHESPYTPGTPGYDPLAPNPLPSGNVATYTSGFLNSKPGFAFTYGFTEARVRFSSSLGMWPAYWMTAADAGWPPEIDIQESIPGAGESSTYHLPNPPGGSSTLGTPGGSPDYTQFHIYGVRVSAADITCFFDGTQIGTYTTAANITSLPFHIILNLAIANNQAGYPNYAGYPAAMDIDYVRAWTVLGVPAQPAITSVSPATGIPGAGQLVVSFPAVSGATSYRATVCPVDSHASGGVTGRGLAVTGSASPLTITGLTNGVPYTVSVAAVNATGYSIESLPVPSLAPVSGAGLLMASFP
jgi:hypothetical protein